MKISYPLRKYQKFYFLIGIFLIVLLAYGLREYTLKNLIADIDEPFYTNISLEYTEMLREGDLKGIVWYRKNFEHPSLVKILYGSVLLTQDPIDQLYQKDFEMLKPVSVDAQAHVFSVRRTSAFIGCITVLFTSLINPIGGLLLAVQNTAIHYTSVYYLEALPTFFAALTLFTYILWKKTNTSAGKEGFPWKVDRWILISSLFLGLTAASKYVYALVGIVIVFDFIFMLIQHKTFTLKSLQVLFVWGFGSLFIFFAANPILWPKPFDRLLDSIQFHLAYAKSTDVTKYNYPFWQPFIWLTGAETRYRYALLIQMDTIILGLAVLGLPVLYKKQREVFLWLVFGMGFLLVWNTKWPQYIMTIVVPVCLSAGAAVQFFLIDPLRRFLANKLTS